MNNHKINIEHSWQALNEFLERKEIFDFLAAILTEYAHGYNESFKISSKKLSYFSGTLNREQQYSTIDIPKKRGGVRTLNIPSKQLKFVQRLMLDFLNDNFKPYKTALGFVKNKAIVNNAMFHVDKKYVICYDIKDFFPTISWSRIFGMLQKHPFNANQSVARFISNLTTYEKSLPQGAPTSPFLSNMLCRKMDSRIFNFFMKHKVSYTRYADDLTFSTNDSKMVDFILKKVPYFIEDEGFNLNKKKTRVMPYFKRQIVTGLIVNKNVNLPREYIRNLRALLFNIDKFGWESQINRGLLFSDRLDYERYLAEDISKSKFDAYSEKQSRDHLLIHHKSFIDLSLKNSLYSQVDLMKMILKGKVDFLGMVKGKEDGIYKKLVNQYKLLELMQSVDDIPSIELYKRITKQIKGNKPERETKRVSYNEVIDEFLAIKKELKKNKEKSNNKTLIKLLDESFIQYHNTISNKIHNPKRTSEILIKFHKDDNVLKYTNHNWDKEDESMKFLSNADYLSFKKMLYNKWPSFNNEFYSINDRIGAKIYNFIKNDNPSWRSYLTEKNIEMGWGDPRFIEWIINNPSKRPDEFRLPNQIRKTNGEIVSNFKDLRALFNREIRFKDGLYNVLKLIKKSKEANDFNIEIKNEDEFRKSYEIYTDVDWFIKGVKEIIKHFRDFSKKSKKIEIALKKIDNRLIIEITHINSYPDSDSSSSSFDEFGEGHLSRIKTKFLSICDWAIESKFKDGTYRLNYLRSDNRDFKEKVENININGFKHILTFYEVTKND